MDEGSGSEDHERLLKHKYKNETNKKQEQNKNDEKQRADIALNKHGHT